MPRAKVDLPALLADLGEITPALFADLLSRTGLSPAYLRRKLLALGHPLHPLVEGVRQEDSPALQRTLRALAQLYAQQPGPARAKVLEARRHLDFALRRQPADPHKQLVLLHLRTWLENPPVYPLWLDLQMKKPPG